MAIETTLVTLITGTAGVSALIGTRMYPRLMPDNATLPCVVYDEMNTRTEVRADGDTGLRVGRYKLHYWDRSYGGIKAGKAALLAAINGYQSGAVDRIEVTDMRDDYEPETMWYRQLVEFEIYYSE
jgi:hypothetical protein